MRLTQCVRRFVLLRIKAFPETKRLLFPPAALPRYERADDASRASRETRDERFSDLRVSEPPPEDRVTPRHPP
jgi:hypothetical protein